MWICAVPVSVFFFFIFNAILHTSIRDPVMRALAALGLTLLTVFVIGPLMDGDWGPGIYGP